MRDRLAIALISVVISVFPVMSRADFEDVPDIVVYCDNALTRPVIAAGRAFRAKTGVPVRIFGMTGNVMRGLTERGTRNDIVIFFSRTMDEAAVAGLIVPGTRTHSWRDPLVFAGTHAGVTVSGKRLAVLDPLPSSPIDGPTLAAESGAATIIGAADVQDAAFLVTQGDADVALLPASATEDLTTLAILPTPPLVASAAAGKNVRSRNSDAFLAYLNSNDATPILARAGLESMP